MRVRGLVFLSLFFLFLLAPLAQAQEATHGKRGGARWGHPSYWVPEDLDLSAGQIERVKSIEASYLEEVYSLRRELWSQRHMLRGLLSDPMAEAGEIKEKWGEIRALEDQIQRRNLHYQARVREILTAEQFNLWISGDQRGFGPKMRQRHGMDRGEKPSKKRWHEKDLEPRPHRGNN